MRKKLLTSLSLGLALAGCGTSIPGSGHETTETRRLPPIGMKKVRFDCPGDIVVTQGSPQSLQVTTDDNLQKFVLNLIRGDVLTLSMAPGPSLEPSRGISFKLTLKDMNQLSLTGAGQASIGPTEATNFRLSVSGAGGINATNVNAFDMILDLSGTGHIGVTGKTTTENITVSGTGQADTRALKAESGNISLSGVGEIDCNVTKHLDVTLSGAGTVHYWGKPILSKAISGVGEVKQN